MTPLLERARAFEGELVELRRDLHRHPELAFRETRTAEAAASRVEALGFRVRRGVGVTGVVAELGAHRGGDGGPVVALRADMDALPITEADDRPYRSTVDGVMHACGHDAHVTMLVGAARLLAAAHDAGELAGGTVRLLFQPSEEASDDEGKSGAVRMIEDGAMEGVDAIYGLHIGAHLPAGRAFLRSGPYMAGTDPFRARVFGESAHAGMPERGVDAILLAAHVVLACQAGVARRISPFDEGVLHVGTIDGGRAENVLADRVDLAGTMRYYSVDVRDRLRAALRVALDVAVALGGRAELDLRPGYPPVVNDADATDLARAACADALGTGAVAEGEMMMAAEDFAFLQREAPGSFFWLGAALDEPREHHHPRFDIDERVLPAGAAALAACAIRHLRERR